MPRRASHRPWRAAADGPGAGRSGAQWAVQPPSSGSEAPVMKDACGVHR